MNHYSLKAAQDAAASFPCPCWVVDVPGTHLFTVVRDLAEAPSGHSFEQPFKPAAAEVVR